MNETHMGDMYLRTWALNQSPNNVSLVVANFSHAGLDRWCYAMIANKRADRFTLDDILSDAEIQVHHRVGKPYAASRGGYSSCML